MYKTITKILCCCNLHLKLEIDTLLNVFLAIAVDNLANAQELTAAEEEAAQQEQNV